MSLADWSLYLSLVMASTISPGPAVLLAMTNGATRGWQAAVYSSLGNVAGLAMLSFAAFLGVGSLFLAFPFAYALLQLTGAAYLIYLGVRKWMTASKPLNAAASEHVAAGGGQLFKQGMLLAMSNPKAILFFGALLPPFIASARPLLPQFAMLTAVLLAFSFVALMSYALLAQFVGQKALSARRVLMFNRVIATAFVLLGTALGGMALSNAAL